MTTANVIAPNKCRSCGDSTGNAEHRLEVIAYPHNPDWQMTRLDAAIFCSAECAHAYLGKQLVVDAEIVEDPL